MDEQVQTAAKPISDDQELAKALAGVSNMPDDLGFEETNSGLPPAAVAPAAAQPITTPVEDPAPAVVADPSYAAPVADAYQSPAPQVATPDYGDPSNLTGDLEGIKKEALTELKPLVGRLELAPEEQFDTYLLLLRSTDDKALIAPAHAAAQKITDETRRAQALLDIIKEIDYFSQPQQ